MIICISAVNSMELCEAFFFTLFSKNQIKRFKDFFIRIFITSYEVFYQFKRYYSVAFIITTL